MATKVRGGQGNASSTAPSVTLAGTPTQGNLLVAWVGTGSSTSSVYTAANGYTKSTHEATQASCKGCMFWKIAGASEPAAQAPCTITTAAWGCEVVEYSATSGWPADPLEIDNAAGFAATTAYVTPTVTPASGIEVVLVAGYVSSNAVSATFSAESFTGSPTTTEDGDAGRTAMASAPVSSTTGSYAGSATASASNAGVGAIGIFKAATVADPFPAGRVAPWQRRIFRR